MGIWSDIQHADMLISQLFHGYQSSDVASTCLVGGGTWTRLPQDLVALASLPLLVVYAGLALCWKVFLSSLYTLALLFQDRVRPIHVVRIRASKSIL